jgi:hypothetical protein
MAIDDVNELVRHFDSSPTRPPDPDFDAHSVVDLNGAMKKYARAVSCDDFCTNYLTTSMPIIDPAVKTFCNARVVEIVGASAETYDSTIQLLNCLSAAIYRSGPRLGPFPGLCQPRSFAS